MSANLWSDSTASMQIRADGTYLAGKASGALSSAVTGLSSLTENQTIHIGASLTGPGAGVLKPFVEYKDAAGNLNSVGFPSWQPTDSWQRFEDTCVVPSGMTVCGVGFDNSASTGDIEMSNPVFNYGFMGVVMAAGSVTVASINDVASSTRYYLLQSSTLTAPSAPTANPPGGSWAATEPTYAEGSTNSLYTCDLTTFSDGTWAYSAVSRSSSYEAAKTAYNKAVSAAAAAAATDNHFWWDTGGVHVSSTGDHDLSGLNLLLTSAKLEFRNALSGLFSIVVSGTSATISFFSGLATIVARTWTYGTTTYTGITIQSHDGVEMECDSPYEGESTSVRVEKTSPSGEEGGCVYLGGKWVHPKDPSITTTDEGYEAHMSSLIALIVGADVHTVAGVDVVTLEKRIADAIQPVVLYNGGAALDYDTAPGAGTAGTVTLSETAANFKELTIFFHYDVWACSSVTLTNPDGKTAGLYLMFVGADGNLWTKTRNVSIGGTSVTNATNAANLATSLANGECLLAQSSDTPEIIIDRVTGRR